MANERYGFSAARIYSYNFLFVMLVNMALTK
jgi:hypothetical protein